MIISYVQGGSLTLRWISRTAVDS